MYPKLRGLDGYRKAVEMTNLKEALPAQMDEQFKYAVDHIEWFNQVEIEKENPAKGIFEDSIDVRREESALTSILNDCRQSLVKRDHITKL